METRHLDPKLLVYFEEVSHHPLFNRLASHVATCCRPCGETLVAAGLTPDDKGPCLHMDEMEGFFERGEDPLLWQLIVHAATDCTSCRHALEPLLAAVNAGDLALSPVPSRRQAALAIARCGAEAATAELLAQRFAEAEAAVRRLPRHRAWGVTEALCRASIAEVRKDPAKGLDVARLAEAAAVRARLPWRDHGLNHLLRMLAIAHRANALRVLGELNGADVAFAEAERHLCAVPAGGEDLGASCGSQFLFLRASLRTDQRRFRLAIADLGEAQAWARNAPELPEQFHAQLLLKLAQPLHLMGRAEESLNAVRRALRELGSDQTTHLALIARQNEVVALLDLERFREVEALLPRLHGLALAVGNKSDCLRVGWANARFAAGTGDQEKAERLFVAVRQGFLEEGSGLRAAIVTLELARVLFHTGKVALVKPLALEMMPIFRAQDLHKEASAALLLFQQAALTEQLTAQFLDRLVRYFHRAQHNPRLRFKAARG